MTNPSARALVVRSSTTSREIFQGSVGLSPKCVTPDAVYGSAFLQFGTVCNCRDRLFRSTASSVNDVSRTRNGIKWGKAAIPARFAKCRLPTQADIRKLCMATPGEVFWPE